MSGVLGSGLSGAGKAGTPGLSANLHGRGHEMRYHAIEDARSVSERLDASLVPADRSLFEVALRRSLGNWIFHVPATIAVLWLSTVIVDLAFVTSALLAVFVLVALVQAVVSIAVAVPNVLFRPFTARGRRGYAWLCATTLFGLLDCVVYGTCLFLLARAAGVAHVFPLSALPLSALPF